MKRSRLNSLIFFLVLFLPLWMFLLWFVWPKKKMAIAIMDKTVLFKTAQEHASLNWVLRNDKFSKTKSNLYQVSRDYFGFFPKEDKQYNLKGLEKFSPKELDKLSNDVDMTYFTDTYGVYSKEWFLSKNITERQKLLYGGLSTQDMAFLHKMKDKKKLIITEFNTFATPTPEHIAYDFENTFKIRWTGWVGKYFDSFDTTKNQELPKWLVKGYKRQHNNQWPFKNSGIAFVNKNDKIIVLEYITHLRAEVPYILTAKEQRKKYNIPTQVKYPFWFDVIQTSRTNQIVSFYDLQVNDKGMKILQDNDLPAQFPAIIEHNRQDYKFFYFCGDFADNPLSQVSSYFKGVTYFSSLFYNDDIAGERRSFFWQFYQPLVSQILNDYYQSIKNNKLTNK